VNVLALRWLGIPAGDFEPMVVLFRDVMGLRVELEEPGTTELSLPDGDRVQVFAPGHRHFELFGRPVALFEVDDVRAARDELVAAGIELVGELERDSGWEWVHFRAPDGNLYDLASRLPDSADSASSSSTAPAAARSRAS
jgi:catechol 2,3-dioxygenase-like lactoylglutathione lyase family enzyme